MEHKVLTFYFFYGIIDSRVSDLPIAPPTKEMNLIHSLGGEWEREKDVVNGTHHEGREQRTW